MNKFLNMLGFAQKSGNTVSGEDTVMMSVKKKKVKLIILAGDASANTADRFNSVAKATGTKIICVATKEEISSAIGKNNRAIIGITDVNFSKKLLSLIDEVN